MRELKCPYRNLSQILEVLQLSEAAIEELHKNVFLDGFHALSDDLMLFQVVKEFEVEGDKLALNYFEVTLLGGKKKTGRE